MTVHARSRSTLVETKTAKRRIRWMGFARREFVSYGLDDDSDNCGVSDVFRTAIVRAFSSFSEAYIKAVRQVKLCTSKWQTKGQRSGSRKQGTRFAVPKMAF
ncbi:hypothetical protein L596_010564 [Steinernema carpocapsae]|uniref:Uncharacterized protein n=1 Tax=Steinernema carpocapsae TaxID=34508 RepID=A0A4U5PJ84_STECR|nr:hypothetical protein L596_010564 [Steinernema carpocapsae]